MVNYINHSKDKFNVKVVWPTKEMVAHKPEWLHETVEFLRDTNNKIGLSFDYAALRDIQDGEEILLDYGDDWQHKWDDHVAQWTPPVDADTYVHSTNYHHKVHGDEYSSPATQDSVGTLGQSISTQFACVMCRFLSQG